MKFDADRLQRLYRYGMALCGDADRAHDLLYDSLETYLSAAIEARNDMAYLRRMMRNRFIDQQRHHQRFPDQSFEDELHDTADFSVETLEQVIIDQDTLQRLWTGFAPLDREILLLWAVEGYTTQEIADALDLPRGTILSRIHRLRQRITAPDPADPAKTPAIEGSYHA